MRKPTAEERKHMCTGKRRYWPGWSAGARPTFAHYASIGT
jgi:hypothetical protein